MSRRVLQVGLAILLPLGGLGCDGGAAGPGDGGGEGEGEGEGEAGEGEGEAGEGEGEGETGEGEGEGGGSCATPVRIDCATGTATFTTAEGAAAIDAYGCASPGVAGFTYPGREQVFSFVAERAARVSVSATRSGGNATTWQLFDLGVGGSACEADRPCVAVRDLNDPTPITFEAAPGEARLLTVDPRAFDDVTPFSLTVSCVLPVCGDGVVELGEACDDDDTDDGDGCDSDCAIEAGFDCAGSPSLCSDVVCGDGVVAGDETCDDANTGAGDGCDAACQVEEGFVCGGSPSSCLQGTGETCLEALPLGGAAATSFSTTALENDSSDYSSCGFFSLAGPEAFYAVEVPAGRLLRAALPTAFDGATLALVTDCAATATSCVAGSGGLGVTSRDVAFANRAAEPRTVFVAVDGSLGRDQGDYALTTSTAALSSLGSTEVCETAALLSPGTSGVTVSGTTVGHPGTANGFGGGACGFSASIPRSGNGRDAFYRVAVPAGKRLRVVVSNVVGAAAAGNGDVVVGIVSDCTRTRSTCLKDADVGSQLQGETVVLEAQNSDREVFVVVDALGPNNGFSFSLTATLE